jgi:uncharacterized damage-inducible protein DinB
MSGLAPPLSDERQLLLSFIAQQRDGVRNAAYGLTDEQARLRPTVGALSIGGLLKHVASTEDGWIDMVLGEHHGSQDEYMENFTMRETETLADVLDRYEQVARRTEEVIGAVDLDAPVPVPKGVPWFPDDVEAWSVRWVLLHLVEETARHAGHADIVRESIDGATMHALMAAVEHWPATEWLKPWEPAS